MKRRRYLLPLVAVVSLAACAPRPVVRDAGAGAWTLYVGLIKTQGYVVGSPLASSGLHRLDHDPPQGAEADLNWTHVGWNTPRISGIAVRSDDPSTMFLASGNGVLRTTDGGVTWRLTTGWEVTEVQDVAVDALRPDEVYLASAYGVWVSKDNGDTWQEYNDGLRRKYTQSIETDSNTPSRVLAATETGIFESTGGAGGWHRVGPAGLNAMDIQQSTLEPDVWLVGAQGGGLWLSRDDGATWRKQEGSGDRSFYGVAINPLDPLQMAATGWDTAVHLTTDGGVTWRRIAGQLPTPNNYEVVFDRNVSGRLWIATVERGVYFTDDFGQTWGNGTLPGTLVFDMLFVPNTARNTAASSAGGGSK